MSQSLARPFDARDPVARVSQLDFPDSPLSKAAAQPLMLGLFIPIQKGGWSASTLPRGTTWHFDYNKRVTLEAERQGFDLAFGLAQWLGKGGYHGLTEHHGVSLDSFVAGNALAALTERIIIISTLHILYGPWHPLHLAKFGATIDHIAKGRWGVNIVTGHREREHLRFGRAQIEHDRRYALSDEFLDIVQRLWTQDEEITVRGGHWELDGAYVGVRPAFGRPIVVNATGSAAGIDFAARHSDIVFTTSPGGYEIDRAVETLPALTDQIRARANDYGRRVKVLINPSVICRETEAEAIAYRDAIADHADTEAVANFGAEPSDAHAWRGHRRTDRAVGGNVQVVGSPEQVVDQLIRLNKAGVDGVQISFYDFEPELAFFGERVIPLLKQAGLRV